MMIRKITFLILILLLTSCHYFFKNWVCTTPYSYREYESKYKYKRTNLGKIFELNRLHYISYNRRWEEFQLMTRLPHPYMTYKHYKVWSKDYVTLEKGTQIKIIGFLKFYRAAILDGVSRGFVILKILNNRFKGEKIASFRLPGSSWWEGNYPLSNSSYTPLDVKVIKEGLRIPMSTARIREVRYGFLWLKKKKIFDYNFYDKDIPLYEDRGSVRSSYQIGNLKKEGTIPSLADFELTSGSETPIWKKDKYGYIYINKLIDYYKIEAKRTRGEGLKRILEELKELRERIGNEEKLFKEEATKLIDIYEKKQRLMRIKLRSKKFKEETKLKIEAEERRKMREKRYKNEESRAL